MLRALACLEALAVSVYEGKRRERGKKGEIGEGKKRKRNGRKTALDSRSPYFILGDLFLRELREWQFIGDCDISLGLIGQAESEGRNEIKEKVADGNHFESERDRLRCRGEGGLKVARDDIQSHRSESVFSGSAERAFTAATHSQD